jgi:hypothetical protein
MMDQFKKLLRPGWAMVSLSLPLGGAIIFLFLSLLMGSFNDAATLIFLSILCTLGISLVIWLPACVVVGYIPIIIFRWLMGGSSERPAEEESDPALSKDQRALLDYIEKARARGLSQERIVTNLQRNGWARDHINWALNFAGQDTP